MKRKIFFLLCFTITLVTLGQVNIQGTIKNKNNEPLPGAVIYLPDVRAGVVSDMYGRFMLSHIPRSNVLIQVKMIGYKTVVRKIDAMDSVRLEIEMEEAVIEEEEIVVTGSNHAEEAEKNPVPMVSIDQQFLQKHVQNNIIEVLNRVPGLSAVSTGPNISKPFIRGLGMNRILTLYDGIRQDGQQWGEEHGVEIDQFLVDRIEVVKGPASLVYGSDALAGVVNLLPENPEPEGTKKASLLTSYNSNNKQYAGSFAFSGSENGMIYGGRASKKRAGNYENRADGKVYGTKYNENGISLFTGINRNWGYTHVHFNHFGNEQEVADGSRDSLTRAFVKFDEKDSTTTIVSKEELNNYDIEGPWQSIQHNRIYAISGFHMGNSRLVTRFGFQENRRREFHHARDPDHAEIYLKLRTSTYDIKFHFPEKRNLDLDLGINGFYQENKNGHAEEYVIPNYFQFDIGPYLHLKKNYGKLDLSGGIRYDNRSFRNEALYTKTDPITGHSEVTYRNDADTTIEEQFASYQVDFGGISAGFGSAYRLSEKTGLKVNLSRGYRAPNVSEIASKGVHTGTGMLQLGNTELKPEFSFQQDLGLYFETTHVSGELDIFNNLITNYIYNEKLASVHGGDSVAEKRKGVMVPVYRYRQTSAQLYGAEFSLDIHPHPLDWLHIENNLSFVNAENLGSSISKVSDSTKYLPFIAPLRTYTEIRADMKKKYGVFGNSYVRAGLQYYAKQSRIYKANGTETPTPAFLLVDLGLGTEIMNSKGQTILKFSVNVNNLTDAIYQNHLSRLKYFEPFPGNSSGRSGIYNMGRDISFRLVVPLQIN